MLAQERSLPVPAQLNARQGGRRAQPTTATLAACAVAPKLASTGSRTALQASFQPEECIFPEQPATVPGEASVSANYLWHGTAIDTGLLPMACPTARAASGRPMERASSP